MVRAENFEISTHRPPMAFQLLRAIVDPQISWDVIEGTEINPRGRALKNIKADIYPQRWFCRPIPRPAPPDAKAARLEAQRHGEMIAKALQRWPSRRGGSGLGGSA